MFTIKQCTCCGKNLNIRMIKMVIPHEYKGDHQFYFTCKFCDSTMLIRKKTKPAIYQLMARYFSKEFVHEKKSV